MKIKNRSRKRNNKRDGIGVRSEESERFHFFRLRLRLRRLRSPSDLVKTRLSESERKGLTDHNAGSHASDYDSGSDYNSVASENQPLGEVTRLFI